MYVHSCNDLHLLPDSALHSLTALEQASATTASYWHPDHGPSSCSSSKHSEHKWKICSVLLTIRLFMLFFPLNCCVCVCVSAQAQLIQMVVWMLQRRLLIQLHTYACLLVPPSEEQPCSLENEVQTVNRVAGRSLSTPTTLSFGSPSNIPLLTNII